MTRRAAQAARLVPTNPSPAPLDERRRIPRRAVRAGVVTVALTVVLVVLSIAVGRTTMPLGDVVLALVGQGDAGDRFVVVDLRGPRALTAVVVGFALGMAGAITQSITRNPLGSPDILGVTSGASTAVVLAIVLAGAGFPAVLAGIGLPLVAVLGGLVTTTLVVGLSWRGGVDGHRLVLVGLGVNAGASAVTSWLLLRADLPDLNEALIWMTGSLNRSSTDVALRLLGVVVVAAVFSVATTRWLSILRFDADIVVALGVRRPSAQLVQVLLAVVLAAAATAAAGPVPFVAFVAPQVAWRAFGTQGPPPLAGGLVGACIVLAADLGSRALPEQLPVGVVTSAAGAPFLLWLLVRESRARA